MAPRLNKNGHIRGRRNALGGLICAAVVGGANGLSPAKSWPNPWKDYLTALGHTTIPAFSDPVPNLPAYEPLGMIQYTRKGSLGAAHRPLRNWRNGLPKGFDTDNLKLHIVISSPSQGD